MRRIIYLSVIINFLLLISCNNDENEFTFSNSPDKADILFDIQYGDEDNQNFDIYLPKDRSRNNTKSIVLIHGGGWIGGDKSDMYELFNVLKRDLPDYAIININYRLADDDTKIFPAQIQDINSAIEYIKAANYHISNDFAIIGGSAGGYLALYYSYRFNDNNNIKLVCSVVGPTDISDDEILANDQMKQILETSIGESVDENPELYEELSPINYVTQNTVPTALFYGNNDPLVPISQAQNLKNSLNQHGIQNIIHIYEGGHGDWSKEDIEDYKANLINFITTNF